MKGLFLVGGGLGLLYLLTHRAGAAYVPPAPVRSARDLDGLDVLRQVGGGALIGAVGGLQSSGVIPSASYIAGSFVPALAWDPR